MVVFPKYVVVDVALRYEAENETDTSSFGSSDKYPGVFGFVEPQVSSSVNQSNSLLRKSQKSPPLLPHVLSSPQ